MDEYFAALPVTNGASLCVGGITGEEAARATAEGFDADGLGYFLFLMDQQDPAKPIELLAKFPNAAVAERVARLILSSERQYQWEGECGARR